MKITVGQLRQLIQEVILEAGGAKPSKPQPTSSPSPPGPVVRQQLTRISAKDLDKPDEIAPHLRVDFVEDEDPHGPVPPNAENPNLSTVDYAKDWGVLPTGNIIR